MNERQNMVIATMVAVLILVVVYLCPWRIEASDEIRWSPINQPPMSYVRSYDDQHGTKGSSRIESDDAHIAIGLLALEVLAVLVAGGGLYLFYSDSEDEEEASSETKS